MGAELFNVEERTDIHDEPNFAKSPKISFKNVNVMHPQWPREVQQVKAPRFLDTRHM
jgi:hypothetical protein